MEYVFGADYLEEDTEAGSHGSAGTALPVTQDRNYSMCWHINGKTSCVWMGAGA